MNVVEQIGFPVEGTIDSRMRIQLLTKIARFAKEHPQAELSRILGESQSRIDDLMGVKILRFNLETLAKYAETLGLQLTLQEAAFALSMSENATRELIRDNKIPVVADNENGPWLIRRETLMAWVAKRMRQSQASRMS
jgi:excisionase family DNA binding protein